jgi:hypothetical protein
MQQDSIFRVQGFDACKIGDHFRVPIETEFTQYTDKDLQEMLVYMSGGEMPESMQIKYKTYIRLPDGDKEA